MKITKDDPWSGQLPDDAAFVFGKNGKNYQTPLSQLLDGSTSGNGTGTNITDYRYNIAEIPDGINKIFTLRFNYVDGNCKVYLNGLRQTLDDPLGTLYDYHELGNKQIEFNEAPAADPDPESGILTLIVVDYLAVEDTTGVFTEEFNEVYQ